MPFRIGPWEIVIILIFLLPVYLVPTIVAAVRHKRNVPRIALVNVLFGWTMVIWIIALVWALSPNKTKKEFKENAYQLLEESSSNPKDIKEAINNLNRYIGRWGKDEEAAQLIRRLMDRLEHPRNDEDN